MNTRTKSFLCFFSFRGLSFLRVIVVILSVTLYAGITAEEVDEGSVIYKDEAPGVLLIEAAIQRDGKLINIESGTGFIVSSSGHILTANHVIPDTSSGETLIIGGSFGPNTVNNKRFELKLLKRSPSGKDAALLQIVDPVQHLHVLRLRTSLPSAGEKLFILGFPLSLPITHLLDGRISAVDSDDLTTNSLISKGNSGGPVIDAQGCVIGIVYGGRESYQGEPVTGIKFAVPIPAIQDLWTAQSTPTSRSTLTDEIIHVSDTLTRTQTDHALSDTVRQYTDRIDARLGYQIESVESVDKNSLNPPSLTYPVPLISPDGKYLTLTYNLLSGPFFDQRRGWIDMIIHTRQKRISSAYTNRTIQAQAPCK